MREHQLRVLNLRGMCTFESGTGYWVNEGQVFVWVDNKLQSLPLIGSEKTFSRLAFDVELDLARALARDLARALLELDILARDQSIDIHLTFLLVRTLIYSRALERVLSYQVSTRSRRWWRGPFQRKSTDGTDAERRWLIYSALILYVDLLIIEERRKG